MNDKPRPPRKCVGCGNDANTITAYRGKLGRPYCSATCYDADPDRNGEHVQPRADVPERHRPHSVGALKSGSR